jgi:hypothetical protein
VLQGWAQDDYFRCQELYQRAGVELADVGRVGLGSVCRRQATDEAARIVAALAGAGLRLHGFGFKLQGLALVADRLASSDSLAWSYDARRSSPLAGHTHQNCANCYEWAMRWYAEKVQPIIARPITRPVQLALHM